MTRFVVRDQEEPLLVHPKPLGAGGQGEVYRATLRGADHALKLYHRHAGTDDQRRTIERLIDKKSPAPCFLWPTHLVEDHLEGRFGYLMPLREARFRSTEDLMARRVTASFKTLIDAALQLADGFLQLHSRGLCYRDISFGNLFIDPATGDVRICDNDNVGIAGTAGGVLGTPRFMAPEIVRAEAEPSAETDRFSLAVLLFYLLLGGHPLEGKREAEIRCLDRPAMDRLYGTAPLYIFDPVDATNRPVAGIHDNPAAFRPIYPRQLLDAFERAFTVGLTDPHGRTRESVWRNVFGRTRDLLMRCDACGAQGFFDPDVPSLRPCWRCRKPRHVPTRLMLRGAPVVLQVGTTLGAHHVQHDPFNYQTVQAEVTAHPSLPGHLGLKNLTVDTWTVLRTDGTVVDVPPGRNAPLVGGNRVNFGVCEGEVVEG